MAKKIVAFGASSSKNSINKQFATWAASQLPDAEVKLLDLNDFEMPIYSIDREREGGMPDLAKRFRAAMEQADGIVVSFAEHNGSYSAAFKNIFDWASRMEGSVWADKPMLLLATSPGARGGQTVLDAATGKFRFMNTNKLVSFSLPSFNQNFGDGITDSALLEKFSEKLAEFEAAL